MRNMRNDDRVDGRPRMIQPCTALAVEAIDVLLDDIPERVRISAAIRATVLVDQGCHLDALRQAVFARPSNN
jgi:molybdenum cofactor biosynthesis enzyme